MLNMVAKGLNGVSKKALGLAMAGVMTVTLMASANAAEYGNGFKQINVCYSLQRKNGSWTDIRQGSGAIFDGQSLMNTVKVEKVKLNQLFFYMPTKRSNIIIDMHLYDGIPKTSVLLHTLEGDSIKIYRSTDNCPIKKI